MKRITLDTKSNRYFDENGYLVVKDNKIAKAGVFDYLGREISDKLDPVAGDIGILIIFKSDSNNIKTGDNSQILPSSFLNYPMYSGIYIGGMLNNEPENYIEIKDDNITINANQKVVINCQNAEINADSEVNINAPNINLGENASLTLINEKITDALNQHTHNYINTAGTPTATTPPLVPFNTAQYSNVNIKESV